MISKRLYLIDKTYVLMDKSPKSRLGFWYIIIQDRNVDNHTMILQTILACK